MNIESETTTVDAHLVTANLVRYAPITSHYRLDDGRHLLVTVPEEALPVPPEVAALLGQMRIDRTESGPTVVYLATADARPLDADGDETNGLTPIRTFDAAIPAVDALAAMGFRVVVA